MELEKLSDTAYRLDDMVFNPYDFGLHPDRDFILIGLRTNTPELVLLVEGQAFYHLSLWSISEHATVDAQAADIVSKYGYEGEYTFKLLN